MSLRAVELLKKGESGRAVGIRDNKIIDVPFEDVDKISINKSEEYETLDMLV
jgi:6-phosphofructokinase 1